VFLAGGYSYADRSDILRAAIQPDGSLGEWTQAGTLPKGLYGEGLVLAGNRVYVAGGYSWSGGYQTSAYMAELQPDGTFSAWTTLASMNQPRYLFGLAYVQGYLFAIGGEGQSDNYTIERAHVLGDGTLGAWEMLGVRSPSPTRFALVEGGNNRLYMIGGGSSSRAVYYADVDAVGNLSAFQGTPLGELPLVEDPAGTYNAPWNGRDAKRANLVPNGKL
jgi:N-acetylneuraminic acid mutarotase